MLSRTLVILSSLLFALPAQLAQSPSAVRVLSAEKDLLRLSWSKPARFESLSGYTVKYRPFQSNSSWLVRQTNETQILLNELRPITKYEIVLQAFGNSSPTDAAGPSTRIEATTDETGE